MTTPTTTATTTPLTTPDFGKAVNHALAAAAAGTIVTLLGITANSSQALSSQYATGLTGLGAGALLVAISALALYGKDHQAALASTLEDTFDKMDQLLAATSGHADAAELSASAAAQHAVSANQASATAQAAAGSASDAAASAQTAATAAASTPHAATPPTTAGTATTTQSMPGLSANPSDATVPSTA